MKVFKWINIAVVLLTLGAYLAPHVDPKSSWVISFLGLAYPALLLSNIGFLGLWAFSKDKYFFLSLITILLGWNHLNGIVGLSFTSNSNEDALKVMTYNLHFFNFYDFKEGRDELVKERQAEADRMIQLIKAEKPDVLFLQEMGSPLENVEMEKLRQSLGLIHDIEKEGTGVKILSRFPILNNGNLKFDGTANAAIFADIELKGEMIRLYNLHLQSLRFDRSDYETIRQPDPNEKESWSKMRGIASKIRKANSKRAEQARIVERHIAQSPHPIILGGDFNDTPSSYTYKRISGTLKDAFKDKGSGLGYTYAGPIPAMRIDYLLSSPSFEILDHKIIKKKYSDHFPVVGTFSLKP